MARSLVQFHIILGDKSCLKNIFKIIKMQKYIQTNFTFNYNFILQFIFLFVILHPVA